MALAAICFSVALAVALCATPLCRAIALRTGFVDRPGVHKSHSTPVPYLGGAAVAAGTFAGLLVGSTVGGSLGPIAIAAGMMGGLGLIDDDRLLLAFPRLAVQLCAASLVIAAGVRVEVTGIFEFDLLLTLVWIVGITNAVNFLDNMDGQAAGIAFVAATATLLTGNPMDQPVIAVIAASVAGSCLGFLPYNFRPAWIFMGDSGALFVGFLVAVATLGAKPALVPPRSFLVPFLLLALPAIDLLTVVLARLRRGISVTVGGRNHLSHRLVARGLGRGTAVAVLVCVEAVVASLAVLTTRDVIPIGVAGGLGVVVLGALIAVTARAPVHHEPVIGLTRKLLVGVGLAIGGLVVLAGPATAVLLKSRADVSDGVDATRVALALFQRGDYIGAGNEARRADALLEAAQQRLDSPVVSFGLAVPVLNSNLTALRAVVDACNDINNAMLLVVNRQVTVSDNGQVQMARVEQVTNDFAHASAQLRRVAERLHDLSTPFLVPAVQRRVDQVRRILPGVLAQSEAVEMGGRIAPELLGSQGDRLYELLMVDANGAKRSAGVLVASKGQLRVQSTQGAGVNPTIAGESARGESAALDGTITLDEHLLPNLLAATGVSSPSNNVVTREATVQDQRAISLVAAHLLACVTRLEPGSAPIGPVALSGLRGRRIDLSFSRPAEQALVMRFVVDPPL